MRQAAALRALPTLLRIGWLQAIAYRAELIIWILTATMPLVMLALWDAVARGGPVGAFGRADFARYFTVTLVARQLTSAWVVWELNYEIRTGGLSPRLMRPMHPLLQDACNNLMALPLRLVVLAPLVAALTWWRPDMGLDLAPWRVAAFMASCALAWGIVFLVQCTFGALAFWLDQSLGPFNVWFGLWSVLGGYLVPVALLPSGLAEVAQVLPFRAMLSVPVEIGAGLAQAGDVARLLAVQAGWLAVALVVATAVWRRGLRRYGAFGA